MSLYSAARLSPASRIVRSLCPANSCVSSEASPDAPRNVSAASQRIVLLALVIGLLFHCTGQLAAWGQSQNDTARRAELIRCRNEQITRHQSLRTAYARFQDALIAKQRELNNLCVLEASTRNRHGVDAATPRYAVRNLS